MNEFLRQEDARFSSPTPEILTPLEFAADFARSVRTSTDRAWIQAMDIETGHAQNIILNSLVNAASRGVDVRITMDKFAHTMVNDRIKYLPKFGDARALQKHIEASDNVMLQRIKKARGQITTTNPDRLASVFPFIGRNHMKIYIADNNAWFGGVNIASDHFQKADFMVKFSDTRTVEQLAKVFHQVNQKKPDTDYRSQINDRYAVLVDKGEKGSSIILDEALQMIGKSEDHIRYISQLPPSGVMLDSLVKQACKGVDVEIVIPSVDNLNGNSIPFGLLTKWSYRKFLQKVKGASHIRVHHFNGHEGKVHAKMLSVDGRVALWGSHNLDEAGVKVGTQEASIVTTDTDLIQKLDAWYDDVKSGNNDLGFQDGPFNPQNEKFTSFRPGVSLFPHDD